MPSSCIYSMNTGFNRDDNEVLPLLILPLVFQYKMFLIWSFCCISIVALSLKVYSSKHFFRTAHRASNLDILRSASLPFNLHDVWPSIEHQWVQNQSSSARWPYHLSGIPQTLCYAKKQLLCQKSSSTLRQGHKTTLWVVLGVARCSKHKRLIFVAIYQVWSARNA